LETINEDLQPVIKKRQQDMSKERQQQQSLNDSILAKPIASPDESTIPMVSMLSQILSTLNITIPLMMPAQSKDDEFEDLDVSRPISQYTKIMPSATVAPCMGELLFPSFNLIVP